MGLGSEAKTKLRVLSERKRHFLDSFVELTTGRNKGLFGVDFWMYAAINRSLSTIDAFCQLTKKRNYLAAFSLVRLHLDTLLRLYATTLVFDANGLVMRLMEGHQLRKEKDRQGKSMNDAYLVEKLQQDFQLRWAKSVYEKTSGFIHLSQTHIYAPIWSTDDGERIANLVISDASRYQPEFEIEAIDCMQEITELLLTLIGQWSKQKPKINHNNKFVK